jgi:hypothetical protein
MGVRMLMLRAIAVVILLPPDYQGDEDLMIPLYDTTFSSAPLAETAAQTRMQLAAASRYLPYSSIQNV